MQQIPSEFVAKMSHDLKTPVGNAMMYADLLSEDIRVLCEKHPGIEKDLEPLLNYCSNIHLTSSKLINAIRSWGYSYQIEDGVFEVTKNPVNLKELLNKVIVNNDIFIQGKSLEVKLEFNAEREIFHTDHEVIYLVVDNLLTLFLTMAGNGDTIRIKISDDSKGVSFWFYATQSAFNEKLVNIFKSDISVKEIPVPEQGILKPGGYGLIFANMALDYIGATRGVENDAPESSSFWFHLPLS